MRKFFLPGCMRLELQYPPKPLAELAFAKQDLPAAAPRVSVVIPSYNQANYLRHTLQSLFSQQYPNLEIIVIDGGSTDGSVDIIKRYSSQIHYWISEPDNGQTHAINKGFAKATGDILAWLNSDDLYLPGAVSQVVNTFEEQPDVDVVYGQRILINELGENIGRWVVPDAHGYILPFADFIPQETLFWRRRLWEETGAVLDEDYHFAMDWELLLRFRNHGARFKKLDRYLGAFRFHPQQKTVAQISETGFDEMNRLRARYAGNGKSYSRHKMVRRVLTFMLASRLKELFFRG